MEPYGTVPQGRPRRWRGAVAVDNYASADRRRQPCHVGACWQRYCRYTQYVASKIALICTILKLTDFFRGHGREGLTTAGREAILRRWIGRVCNLPLAIGLWRIASCSASYACPLSWTSFSTPYNCTFTGTMLHTFACWSWSSLSPEAGATSPVSTAIWIPSITARVVITSSWRRGGTPRQYSAIKRRSW